MSSSPAYDMISTRGAGKEHLKDQDIIKLTFLPLMKTVMARSEMAYKTVTLAMSIEDKEKRDACIATTIAYASKVLSSTDMDKLLEAIRLTDLGAVMAEFFGKEKAKIDIAKRMLLRGTAIEIIAEDTELDISTVSQLQKEFTESTM